MIKKEIMAKIFEILGMERVKNCPIISAEKRAKSNRIEIYQQMAVEIKITYSGLKKKEN